MKKIKFRYVKYNDAYQLQYKRWGFWKYLGRHMHFYFEIFTKDTQEEVFETFKRHLNLLHFTAIEYPMIKYKTV